MALLPLCLLAIVPGDFSNKRSQHKQEPLRGRGARSAWPAGGRVGGGAGWEAVRRAVVVSGRVTGCSAEKAALTAQE